MLYLTSAWYFQVYCTQVKELIHWQRKSTSTSIVCPITSKSNSIFLFINIKFKIKYEYWEFCSWAQLKFRYKYRYLTPSLKYKYVLSNYKYKYISVHKDQVQVQVLKILCLIQLKSKYEYKYRHLTSRLAHEISDWHKWLHHICDLSNAINLYLNFLIQYSIYIYNASQLLYHFCRCMGFIYSKLKNWIIYCNILKAIKLLRYICNVVDDKAIARSSVLIELLDGNIYVLYGIQNKYRSKI